MTRPRAKASSAGNSPSNSAVNLASSSSRGVFGSSGFIAQDHFRSVCRFVRVIPPHPCPLPWGEGEPFAAMGKEEALRTIERRTALHPLPKGEGRGEGEHEQRQLPVKRPTKRHPKLKSIRL